MLALGICGFQSTSGHLGQVVQQTAGLGGGINLIQEIVIEYSVLVSGLGTGNSHKNKAKSIL